MLVNWRNKTKAIQKADKLEKNKTFDKEAIIYFIFVYLFKT